MAEIVANFVLGRITDAAYAEVLSLLEVGDKVERVKRDLKWISAFLKDADAKRNKDERVKQWVEEVKEVAYMIEDVLDEYFAKMGGGRSRNFLKKIGHFPEELVAKHKLDTEIDKIDQRMNEIKANTEKFGITRLESGNRDRPMQFTRPVENPDIGKVEVVGFEDDFNNICKLLLDQSVSRRSVISIVGPGGRGKTTLAKKLYKSAEEKLHFNSLIWITISKEFIIVDILKKMLRKLREINENEERRDEEHFLIELNKSLRNKKYLIVLDDVWFTENRNESLWARLHNALPDDGNGSRVLITIYQVYQRCK
ncbi:Disease resistance protein (CC-NBS-LRR class) family [Rhynchospora pubera]|uniref:Disease resistance protein (CC-NBS-LRR class) family n=1 Tax=Rhynchospora pubera TaxID=906938 RepID=A0AAV8F6A7_9POAL|nr:Disease resistance protein (CC-NBS-LRR class) family [Rhynchospora pubera]